MKIEQIAWDSFDENASFHSNSDQKITSLTFPNSLISCHLHTNLIFLHYGVLDLASACKGDWQTGGLSLCFRLHRLDLGVFDPMNFEGANEGIPVLLQQPLIGMTKVWQLDQAEIFPLRPG